MCINTCLEIVPNNFPWSELYLLCHSPVFALRLCPFWLWLRHTSVETLDLFAQQSVPFFRFPHGGGGGGGGRWCVAMEEWLCRVCRPSPEICQGNPHHQQQHHHHSHPSSPFSSVLSPALLSSRCPWCWNPASLTNQCGTDPSTVNTASDRYTQGCWGGWSHAVPSSFFFFFPHLMHLWEEEFRFFILF